MQFAKWYFNVKCTSFGLQIEGDAISTEGTVDDEIKKEVEDVLTELITNIWKTKSKEHLERGGALHHTELFTNAALNEQYNIGAPPIAVQLFEGGREGILVQVRGHFDGVKRFQKENIRIANENHN
jgi:hypothetical protein